MGCRCFQSSFGRRAIGQERPGCFILFDLLYRTGTLAAHAVTIASPLQSLVVEFTTRGKMRVQDNFLLLYQLQLITIRFLQTESFFVAVKKRIQFNFEIRILFSSKELAMTFSAPSKSSFQFKSIIGTIGSQYSGRLTCLDYTITTKNAFHPLHE